MARLKTVLKFIGLIFLTLSVNIFPMRLIATQETTPTYVQWLASLGYILVASIVILLVWKKYKNKDEKEKFSFTWKDFGIALLFYLATRLVAVGGTYLIQMVTGNATSANDAALIATNEQLLNIFPLYFTAFHVAIGIFAPIMEELVFRGFFSHYFFKSNKKRLKLIISSTIFAVLHIVYPVEFITYFALGSIFYLAYVRRGNIMDSIAVHLLNNSLLVIFSIVNYLLLILG